MVLNISKELAALERMTLADLRAKYAEVFGEGTSSRHRQFLIRRILWRLQANEEGDLSERARQRAKELAAHADALDRAAGEGAGIRHRGRGAGRHD